MPVDVESAVPLLSTFTIFANSEETQEIILRIIAN